MKQDSESVLVKKIARGNRRAFREIYNRYHKQLYFVAKRYLKENQLSEDAIQNIFIKLWNNRKSLDPSKSLKSFLFTILRNHLLNTVRDRKGKILSEYRQLHEQQIPHSNSTENRLQYAEYQEILERGMAELSEGKRAVFEMRVFEGLSNEEVARKRSVSVHTVKSQYYKSCRFIRSYLQEQAGIIS